MLQHLLRNANRNKIRRYVSECEQNYIIRQASNKLLTDHDIIETPDDKPRSSRQSLQVGSIQARKQRILNRIN